MTTAQSWRTPPAEPAPEESGSSQWSAYLPAVDGLRFFAFLMVFLFHFEEPFQLDAWQGFERVGWVGVEIFFVISGFLMFHLLEREWEATGKIRIGQFYLRRVLRIYPLMLTYPLLMLLIFGPQNGFAGAWLASIAAFTANYLAWVPAYPEAIVYNRHLWTLAYEFQIYAAIPLAFLAYKAVGRRSFALGLVAATVLTAAARGSFVLAGMEYQSIWVTPFLRPDSSIAGIVIAIFYRDLPKHWMPIFAAASGALIVLGPPIQIIDTWTMIIFPLSAVFAGSLLVATISWRPLSRILASQPIRYLGKVSFGLYVFHEIGMDPALYISRSLGLPENHYLRMIYGLLMATLFASTSYYLLERPFLKIKTRFSAVASHPV